ncbi:hypothetical protein SAY87_026382 [Trapa incisa]|uniref:Uncharacterized protein n=1 Tax=Trapa incisa TaxID=236973 RepID=A0AAN7GUS0_9MYRT|nr:hypothetical protein SAY87_026382 [Trapa incisa]
MVQNGSQSHKTRQMSITKSVEDGLLRNLIFPGSSLTSKRRQNSSRSLTVSHTSKVSPRPSFSDDPAKGLDRWKRFSASNKVKHGILEVDLAGGSSNKNNTKNCKNRRDVASKQNFGCCLFSTRKKGTLRE